MFKEGNESLPNAATVSAKNAQVLPTKSLIGRIRVQRVSFIRLNIKKLLEMGIRIARNGKQRTIRNLGAIGFRKSDRRVTRWRAAVDPVRA
jgi:hypothetical protein